jgi:diadenosine tetraphosphate (Ap4A) HIT family hydrolase
MAVRTKSELTGAPSANECVFCERVRALETFRDLVVFESRDFLASHQIGDDGRKALGVLHVQAKRHVPSLGALSGREAQALGPLLTELAAAIETVTGAPWTYCFGFTEGPRHVHLVLGARYADLPDPYLRLRFAEWPDGPHGDRPAIAALSARLRAELDRRRAVAFPAH